MYKKEVVVIGGESGIFASRDIIDFNLVFATENLIIV